MTMQHDSKVSDEVSERDFDIRAQGPGDDSDVRSEARDEDSDVRAQGSDEDSDAGAQDSDDDVRDSAQDDDSDDPAEGTHEDSDSSGRHESAGNVGEDDDDVSAEVAEDFPAIDHHDEDQLLPQLVAHLRQHRTKLREEWASRIHDSHLLEAMTSQEMTTETQSVYDNYVEVLETGSVDALQHYARDLSERIIPRGVETHEVVGIVLLLRDVLARSLFEKYQQDFALLNRVLDAYEPAANRIANTVAVSFVDERERVIRKQQDSIRELSTPVLPVRERLLIMPMIGVLDSERARQLTEQLLAGIRTHRAKVVVIDVTGAPEVDEAVANHLVRTVDASRLMGASCIITGLSPEIAQTLVTIGVDLSKMNTIGDLQGGLEEAERLLGYAVRQPVESSG
jgi:rsbT co-antagonist protein RsbR